MLDSVAELNRKHADQYGDPEIHTRIRQYEMAYRMQTSVPDLMDLSKEPESTFEMYGPESRKPGTYAVTVEAIDLNNHTVQVEARFEVK